MAYLPPVFISSIMQATYTNFVWHKDDMMINHSFMIISNLVAIYRFDPPGIPSGISFRRASAETKANLCSTESTLKYIFIYSGFLHFGCLRQNLLPKLAYEISVFHIYSGSNKYSSFTLYFQALIRIT